MEDLLEELLNVLAPPSNTGSARKEVPSIKPSALSNGFASQKTQVKGFLASQKMAQKTAHKATEKMSREKSHKTNRALGQGVSHEAVDERQSALMTVASLSDWAIDRLLKAAQSLNIAVDTADISVESLLFDAGVAVPELVGHRAFGVRDELASEAPLVLKDEVAVAEVDEAAVEDFESETPLSEIPLEEIPLEEMPLEDPARQEPEDGRAEIDEYVMSAFDIGDFEADTHAAQADTQATKHFETNGRAGGESDSSNFDPDDFELDLLHLETLDLQDENSADLGAEDNSNGRLATADVSLDELVAATEQNFLARWFKRLMGAKAVEPEVAEAGLSEPRLFGSDDSRREVQSESTANRDVEYDSDFYAEQTPERSLDDLEPVLELPVDDAVSGAGLVLENDEETEVSEVFEDADSFEASEKQVTDAGRRSDLPDVELPDVDLSSEMLEISEAMSEVVEVDSLLVDKRLIEEPLASDAFALEAFESAFGEFDENGFDEDSLLEPLGEKTWLSEADNATEALHVAAATGDISSVWAALEANASVNALGLAQQTALSTALAAGHVPVVALLLEMCADPNLPDVVNGSPVRYPLMAAIEAAEPVRAEIMHLLLASGAEVDQADVMGQTALMGAAKRGYVDAMRLLIEANANLDVRDLLGQTAMLLAKGHGHEGAIAQLQASTVDRERAIAFLKAVTQGELTAVEQWLAAGMSANTRVARMSALTQAAAKGEVAIAKLLIESGADIDYRFYETDPTPLFHAAYRGQLEMVSLLLEAGASPCPTPGYPIGALDYAEMGQQKANDAKAFEPIVALLATLAPRSN